MRYDMIYDTEKLKIDSRYDSRFDNYASTYNFKIDVLSK